MINPTHIRIGNIVAVKGEPAIVIEVCTTDMLLAFVPDLAMNRYWQDEVEPIPLTPEVFKKCQIPDPLFSDFLRFYEADTATESKIVAVFKYRDGDSYLHDRSVKVEYLHQLQNLYYSLYNEGIIYQP